MPTTNLWSAQIEAIRNLERSLAANKRRALIQIEHGIGVAEEHAYSIKKIDSDYFDEA